MTPPTWQGPDWRIHCGDCLELLKSLPSGSVDAVVTDPPYSSGGAFRGDRMAKTSNKYRGWSQNDDGSSREPEAEYPEFTGDNRDQRGYLYWCALWLSECRRILSPGGIVLMFTDWRQLPTTTDAMQAGGIVWRGIVVWDKGIGRPIKGRFRNHVEYVCWGSNGPMADADCNPVYLSSVFRYAPPNANDREHMTQKPDALLAELLAITKPQGTVLDPFMGSGTTGVACVQTCRKFIGFELDARYCEIAARRIGEVGELFRQPQGDSQ